MIIDESNKVNSDIELFEESFALFTDEMSETHFEQMSEEEFFDMYSDSDDLLNYLEDEFKYIEVDQKALIEAAMVDSYQLSEAPQQSGLMGTIGNVQKNVQKKTNQIKKDMNKKPIATNIFMRIFNVIKNAFGVIAAFMERAMTTFKINNLRSKINSMPDGMRFETCKGFLDNTVDNGIRQMNNLANGATKFLSDIFIVGRMVDQNKAKTHFDKFGKIAHGITDALSKVLTVSKQGVLKQLDSLQRMFQHYSQVKVMQRSFLTVMNICSDPRKMANAADKLMKATTGQGFTGAAGVGLDLANKFGGSKNIMSNPVINFVVNNACKLIGNTLAHYKKVINDNLRYITQAYEKAVTDPKNRGAIKSYQNKASKYSV